MTYLFSLKIYRIFFPSSLPAPSILKFCYEVPYIHNWVYHSTWKLISLKFWEILLNYFADDCFSVILSHDTHFLFFLKLLLFRCQIFRLTFKPTFLSFLLYFLRFPQLYLPTSLLSFSFVIIFSFQKLFCFSMFFLWYFAFI